MVCHEGVLTVKKNITIFLIILVIVNVALLFIFVDKLREGTIMITDKILHAFMIHKEGESGEWWVCPMHPFYKRKQPGECGICGMSLVPQSELQETEEGIVMLSPKQIQLAGVKTEEVRPRNLKKTIDTYGKIDYDEREERVATAWVSGRIDKLYVNFTGTFVEKGAPLVWIYSPDLITTQEEYLLALETSNKIKDSRLKDSLDSSQELMQSAAQRLRWWGITEEQIKKLEMSKKVQDHITIYSPISGTVVQKHIYEGMYIDEGTPLFTITPLNRVWLYADIYEYEISLVALGQEVQITTRAFPGETFKGKVSFIDPFLNPETRTVRIRCDIPNPDNKLKPDMYARAVIEIPKEEHILSVPEAAVLHSGKRDIVFINLGGGRFEPRQVQLGSRMNGYYEVLRNLKEGEEVVTSANFLLSSESQLQGALDKLEGLAEDVEWEKREHEKLAQKEEKHRELKAKSVHGMREHKKIIRAYLDLRKILAQDSLEGASPSQKEMLASLDALLKKPSASQAFDNLLRDIKENVSSMNLEEIEKTREDFVEISKLMIDFIDTVHLDEMPLYVFRCPMYPGVWIQENDTTENPYYGSAMLKCGEVISRK